jgi:hypothetical protein
MFLKIFSSPLPLFDIPASNLVCWIPICHFASTLAPDLLLPAPPPSSTPCITAAAAPASPGTTPGLPCRRAPLPCAAAAVAPAPPSSRPAYAAVTLGSRGPTRPPLRARCPAPHAAVAPVHRGPEWRAAPSPHAAAGRRSRRRRRGRRLFFFLKKLKIYENVGSIFLKCWFNIFSVSKC